MCQEAIRQDGWILQFVKKQTPEICLEAVKQDKEAFEFVKDKYRDYVFNNL